MLRRQEANGLMILAEGKLDFMQRVSRFPTPPGVPHPRRRKNQPFFLGHGLHFFIEDLD